MTYDASSIKKRLKNITTLEELSQLLECDSTKLHDTLFKLPIVDKYEMVLLRQRNGKERKISIPCYFLMKVQKKISEILCCLYQVPTSVHGFVHDKSIATNAMQHENQHCILSIDIKDFFDSINFGRIRGLFIAPPYLLSPKLATILAQICCLDNKLPQGAPSSPILSNMICSHMDFLLARFLQKNRCTYTRYADDITISTKKPKFPKSILTIIDGDILLSRELREIIEIAPKSKLRSFEINEQKIRLQKRGQRMQVTGLIVNNKVNIPRKFTNQIRAMLHAWEKYGLEAAQDNFDKSHDKKNRFLSPKVSFKKVVKGKLNFLAMVRGNDDILYRKLLKKYASLDRKYTLPQKMKKNHLVRNEDYIFVLEDAKECTSQGTAFYLENFGFVTCAHVFPEESMISNFVLFHYKNPNLKYKISNLKISKELDIAVFTVKMLDISGGLRGIKNRLVNLVQDKSPVEIKGFPNHTHRSSITTSPGYIISSYERETKSGVGKPILRYKTNAIIRPGISGGPVFNKRGTVIGVAAVGETSDTINEIISLEYIYSEHLFVDRMI